MTATLFNRVAIPLHGKQNRGPTEVMAENGRGLRSEDAYNISKFITSTTALHGSWYNGFFEEGLNLWRGSREITLEHRFGERRPRMALLTPG